MSVLIYTGVGSRKAPPDICNFMERIGYKLAKKGVLLRSGGAEGSDSAFERGCDKARGPKEIYTKAHATEQSMSLAAKYHPKWAACSHYARLLHGRNPFQVLGINLNVPSSAVICWTPDGCISHSTRSRITGGTGTAISVAEAYNIPIYNLALPDHLQRWIDWINKN